MTYSPGAAPPPSELGPDEDEVAERRRSGKRFHDGFYLRLGLGAGYITSSVTRTEDTEPLGRGTGATIPVEFALGGTPTPGFVIGAGSWAVHVPGGTHSSESGEVTREAEASYGSISMLGPFADIYPAPRAGFHIQFAPCLTLVGTGTSSILPSELTGIGFGGMLGFGYEGWVSDQWGMGVLARGQFAYAQLTSESGDPTRYNFFGFTPSLLFTATLH